MRNGGGKCYNGSCRLSSELAGSTLNLVDGIVGGTIDEGDIRLEGWTKELLVELHGTLRKRRDMSALCIVVIASD